MHPLTLEALERAGVPTAGLASKSSEAHADLHPDLVITVCDKAAGEACTLFFGPAIRAHWGLANPSAQAGSDAEVAAAFDATLSLIRARIRAFLALPHDQLDAESLRAELARIGSL